MSRGQAAGERVLRASLAAGFVAGTLDIVAACLYYGARGASPMRILQAIASGLLGRADAKR